MNNDGSQKIADEQLETLSRCSCNVKVHQKTWQLSRDLAHTLNALENLFEVTALAPRLASEGIGDDELAALRDEAFENALVALSNHTAMLTSEAIIAYINERGLPFEGWEDEGE